jgi:hypothetical protein
MADKLPFEEPLRRAVDANMRYYEALGRVTQEYWKAIFGIVRELPVRFGAASPAATAAHGSGGIPNPTATATTATLVLEAESGGEARGVFLVENRLGRVVSTAVVTSAFTNPSGRALQPTIRVEPGVVTLPPGGRTLVQIFAVLDDNLETDIPYRGEVNVPGLSESGIPVMLRRLGGSVGAASPEEKPAGGAGRRGTGKPAKRKRAARGGRTPKKRGEG